MTNEQKLVILADVVNKLSVSELYRAVGKNDGEYTVKDVLAILSELEDNGETVEVAGDEIITTDSVEEVEVGTDTSDDVVEAKED